MSNDAINHTVKLTVKDGQYSLTMQFKGLTVGTNLGYLGELRYFKTGYTQNEFGAPQGDKGEAEVLSYQMTEDGEKLSDDFGTDYPEYASFPMIPEALDDGYVPLEVSVPLADKLFGMGTQPVYLKLDWNSLEETTDDDEDFGGGSEETPASEAFDETDPDTGVRVFAAAGIVPDGTSLKVVKITSGTEYDTVKANSFISGNSFELYDISLVDADDKDITLNGRVSVSLPVPQGWDTTKLAVYHFNDDNTATPSVGTAADGMYTFSTAGFSKFALMQRKNGSLTPGGINPTLSPSSKLPAGSTTGGLGTGTALSSVRTGDNATMIPWVTASAAALAVIILACLKLRKKAD